MTVQWSFPTRIVFGEGSAAKAGAEVLALESRSVLIVSDKGVVEAGIVDDVGKSLRQAQVSFSTFDEVSSNPKESEVLSATEAFRQAGADAVIGVGGGSALDVAKLVRVLYQHDLPLADLEESAGGPGRIRPPLPPMVAVPTTAGTGSEVGRSAVVSLEATQNKVIVFSPLLMPDVAILDPALSVSLPPLATAATGFDALTHCIEAYCASGDHPMADAIAMQGLGHIAGDLEKAVADGSDLSARGNLLKGAMMGGVAFQKGLGACHALAHPLSAKCDLHHGLANALCLPAVIDFNRTAIPDRIARIARIMGVRGEDQETLTFECAGAVKALRRKVGLPEGLAAAGVDEEMIPTLAEQAAVDPVHELNPRPCTKDDMIALYRASI